jgi:hypothetical protein
MQRFSGQVFDENGKNLEGATVTLSGENINKKTTTNKNGYYTIIVPNNVDSTKTNLTYAKEGSTLKSIKNPQPTSTYTPSEESKIDNIYGGNLNLNNSFDSGKYLISSLKTQDRDILDFELFSLKEFIKNNPGNYNIFIKASESKVPNNDREEFLEDGSLNENWAGPEGEFRPKGKLIPKALSEKRLNSLKKYIEDSFKEEGIPTPTITSEVIISGPNYNPDNVPKEDLKKYQESFKQYQYTTLNASLLQVNCTTREVNRGKKFEGDKILYKPPGATKITLDAFQFPDRFGINGKYLDYYTQSPNTVGSVASWEFIVYLSLFNTSLLNDDTITRKEFNPTVLKTQLLADMLINGNIKLELLAFIKKSGGVGSTDTNLKNEKDQLIIDLAIQNSVGARPPVIYGYPIKRENTVISLTNIGESFTLNQRKGVIDAPSIYSFNICDNR